MMISLIAGFPDTIHSRSILCNTSDVRFSTEAHTSRIPIQSRLCHGPVHTTEQLEERFREIFKREMTRDERYVFFMPDEEATKS